MAAGVARRSVADANARTWRGDRYVSEYATRVLRPVEVVLLARYAETLRGRVLELGCGAGRITGYLAALSAEVDAVDLSAAMLAECGRRYPGVRCHQHDASDLSPFDDARFDAVVAGFNVLDVYGDTQRRHALREARRVLVPGGLLIMSSHNRAYLPQIRRPWAVRPVRPRAGVRSGLLGPVADLVRMPGKLAAHRRLRALETATPDYALVSDGSHGFSLVHYYIDPPTQRRQLIEAGLELRETLDLDGGAVGPDEAPDCPELHYVAQRPAA